MGLLAVLACAARAVAALTIVIPARPKYPPPAPPADRLSPELVATVKLHGKFDGLTVDGDTVILLPNRLGLTTVNTRLGPTPPGVVLGPPTVNPDPPRDEIHDLVVFYDHGALPPVGSVVARMQVVDHYKAGGWVVLRASRAIDAGQLLDLEDNPDMRFAQPNYRYRLAASPPPNDPSYLNDSLTGLAQIHAPDAWKTTHDSSIRVAILDTGIDYTHPDLVQNVWTNDAELNGDPGVDDDCNGCVDDIHGCDFLDGDGDPWDTNGHGTSVAGIIAETGNNAVGGVGVAWKVTLIAVRIINSNTTVGSGQQIAKAMDYAVNNGAKVMNVSWYGRGWSDYGVSDAVSRAEAKGVLLVAAAGGNPPHDLDASPEYPSCFTQSNVVAVLGVGADDSLSASSWGATSVDLGAPGQSVLTTDTLGKYIAQTGTSFATAFVSGAAALVWGSPGYGTLTGQQIRDVLLSHVFRTPKLTGLCATSGRLDLGFLATPPPTEPTP